MSIPWLICGPDFVLPLDVLVLIAKVDLSSYRRMLAVPLFARYTLRNNVEFRRHFTVKTTYNDKSIIYTLNGRLHRDDDLPTMIWTDGRKLWYKNNKLHRENDLPAMEFEDGGKQWYRDGKPHRGNDQPAMVWADGEQRWYIDGKLHRDNGQAAEIWANGIKFWYINGESYTPEI